MSSEHSEHSEHSRPSELDAALDRARARMTDAGSPGERLVQAAWLAALGEPDHFVTWPSMFTREESAAIPDWITETCSALVVQLREATGERLVDCLLRAQAFACLMQWDREHGSLLEPVHRSIEAVMLECSPTMIDDDAACVLQENEEVRFLRAEDRLPVISHPVGVTACTILVNAALVAGLDEPARPICTIPVFEPELVYDTGRPSERMMRRYAERQGVLQCRDGSSTRVQAVLEEDWRVSIQFESESKSWCDKIDKVRVGTRMAETMDEDREFWTASLAQLGLDAQTRLVNQPILVTLATGERFIL